MIIDVGHCDVNAGLRLKTGIGYRLRLNYEHVKRKRLEIEIFRQRDHTRVAVDGELIITVSADLDVLQRCQGSGVLARGMHRQQIRRWRSILGHLRAVRGGVKLRDAVGYVDDVNLESSRTASRGGAPVACCNGEKVESFRFKVDSLIEREGDLGTRFCHGERIVSVIDEGVVDHSIESSIRVSDSEPTYYVGSLWRENSIIKLWYMY